VTDSQYNLAILYARGIGVPVNLAESYRWFSLAAASGDRDATRKRDEVAARLDQQTVTATKLVVQGFVPEREPDEATNLKAPPGGWDHVPAAPAKPRR
jgi:localization factor PodJL